MHTLYDKYPDDFEAQTFYALALMAVGYRDAYRHNVSESTSSGCYFGKVVEEEPESPGVVHYLIHSYDYPALAKRGLAAAQSYSSIAPWVPHALHMPSHIFTRLGHVGRVHRCKSLVR